MVISAYKLTGALVCQYDCAVMLQGAGVLNSCCRGQVYTICYNVTLSLFEMTVVDSSSILCGP